MTPRRRVNAAVARQLTEHHLEQNYPGCKRVFTDGSVRPSDGSSTAAVVLEDGRRCLSGKLEFHASSMSAELAALGLAVAALVHVGDMVGDPVSWVVCSDSRAALTRLAELERAPPLARRVAMTAGRLTERGHGLTFQWVPAHCGVGGNEAADSLADRTHDGEGVPVIGVGKFDDAKLLVARDTVARHPDARLAGGDRPARIPRSLGRQAAAIVHRLRTGSAWTVEQLHRLRRHDDPACDSCGELGDAEHAILGCREYAEREAMLSTFRSLGLPSGALEDILRPTGSAKGKKKALGALIDFLVNTGLTKVL